MTKVVWLFPPSEKGGFPNISQYRFYKRMPIRSSIIYPYIASIGATLLKEHGYDISFLDCPTMNIAWDEVFWEIEYADFVVIESRTPIMPDVWSLCSEIRYKFPDVKIILYGDHVSWNPEESLPYCDIVVRGGNYDYGVFKAIDDLSKDLTISRTFYENPKSLDDLPFPDRRLVPHDLYYESWRNRDLFFWTMSMRGCYYRCIFCAWTKTFWNNRITYRSVNNVVDEYWDLYNEYGSCQVLDDADMFDTDWGKKFAKEMIKTGFDHGEILWAIQTHPNMIKILEDMKLMRKSGLRTVKLGLESLNDKTLFQIGKSTNLKQIEKAFRILKDADIMIHANLMVGFPFETKKDAWNTIKTIKKLDPNQAQFSLIIPYPNTKLYDLARENDWLLVKEGDWEKYDAWVPMLKMEGLSSEEIIQLYLDHWGKFYDWRYSWNHLKKVRHWEGIKQLWRGFISIYFGHMRAIKR